MLTPLWNLVLLVKHLSIPGPYYLCYIPSSRALSHLAGSLPLSSIPCSRWDLCAPFPPHTYSVSPHTGLGAPCRTLGCFLMSTGRLESWLSLLL